MTRDFLDEPFDPRPPGRRTRSGATQLAAGLAAILIALVAVVVLVPGISLPGGPAGSQPAPTGLAVGSPAPAGPSAAPTFVRPTPTPMPTFVTYVVRRGDTLTSIARTYRTTPRSISWWNRGTYPSLDPESAKYSPNSIQLGWTLVVLPGAVVDDANPPTPSPAPGAPSIQASPQPSA